MGYMIATEKNEVGSNVATMIAAKYAECGDMETAMDSVCGAGAYAAMIADIYHTIRGEV